MYIVYLFVSVLLLYQSVIKIDVPNKWASACVQPAIDGGRRRSMTVLAKQTTPLALCCLRSVIKVSLSKAICSQKIYTRLKKEKKRKKKEKILAAKKSGGTTDRVTADQRYNGARYSEA